MAAADQLNSLVPISSLGPDSLRELAARTVIATLCSGERIFEEGDTDNHAIYLLTGEVTLSSSRAGSSRTVSAGSEEARYALAQLKPRQYRGTAKGEATIARVDGALLDRLITMEQSAQAGGIEVVEFGGSEDSDWVLRLLRQEAFQKLPPANFNALLQRLEALEVKGGQVVIRQGDAGDYYYLIKTGRASVSRKADSGRVAILGDLGEGDGFGEEALLSGAPRNATVVMRTDGTLMRLAKKDFDELLKEPLVHWVGEAEARALVQAGAGLIDVRLEDEFRSGSIRGALNVPLYTVRLKAAALDRSRKYVLVCQTGNRSAAAAFLLSQRGLDVCVLRGGLTGLRHVS